ncbi:MAG: fibronectin type III domain-containing protein [Planctomycetota bacterium]|jgi:hypothetical protein
MPYIDTLNDKATDMQTDDYQFLVNLKNVHVDLQGTGTGKSYAWNGTWQSAAKLNGTLNYNTDTDTSYTIEIAIPWKTIGITPQAGMIVGMDLTTDDKDSVSSDFFDWAGITTSYAKPDLWKEVELSDASISLPSPTDTTPPLISGVYADYITSSGATINWITDEASDSQVEYGTTESYGNSTTLDSFMAIGHSQTISGLSPATVYYYRVLSRDAAGNLSVSGDYTLITSESPDTTPPVISGVYADNITSSGATINWITDEASDSKVEYGTNTSYSKTTTLESSIVNGHSQAISGLSPSTVYYYRVLSRDASGNLSVSGDHTVTTSNPPDTTPPVISGVYADNITSTGATINWTTDEASDSQVEYGTTTSYGNSTTLDSSMVTGHSQALSGIYAAIVYHYRVLSRDASDNLSISDDYTFTTAGIPLTISNVIVTNISSTSATVTWTSNKPATSQVEYGTNSGNLTYATVKDTTMVIYHSVTVSDLSPSTTYYFRAVSEASPSISSPEYNFTTHGCKKRNKSPKGKAKGLCFSSY